MDQLDKLYGNDQLKLYIRSKISDGTLPHALIFEGAEGSGRSTLATLTAMALSPQFADKIERGQSPDVTVCEPAEGKKSIGVATVRDIREAAFIMPQELNVRIFIIRSAHLMTTEAQNALLKILEEPPAGVYFFLLCDNSSLLLPTVRSRAPVLKMSVLSDEELAEYIIGINQRAEAMSKSSPEAFSMLIRSCGGSVGCAISRLGEGNGAGEKLRDMTAELIHLIEDTKTDGILLFFVKNKLKREELSTVLLYLSCAMRDMLKLKYGSLADTAFFASVEAAEEQAASFARSTLMAVYTCSEELREKLSVNVNADAFSVRCADVLSEAARK